MASYLIVGHPLNYADLAATPGATVDAGLSSALRNNGVGQTVTLTLSGPDDTKAKGHGWVKQALSPDPFITAQDLSDYLGRDVSADNGAVIALDAACDICRTIGEQQFNRGTSTYVLDGSGTDALLLPDLPVNSAGTVLVNGGTVTDYTLNGNGILFRGTAGCDPRPVWPTGRQNVRVTADHGYDVLEIPRDVRMVALSIASRLVIQGPAAEETLGASRIRYSVAATDLTNGEMRILRKYRPTR